MSKIFVYANKMLVKVTGHKYTEFTVKTPFINLSFAPAQNFLPRVTKPHPMCGCGYVFIWNIFCW